MKKLVVMLIIFIMLFQIERVESEESIIAIELPCNEKNQPVDMFISFDRPCYARDEQHNSIKVFYKGNEIESQIYNLQHVDGNHIKGCNIVFLSQGKGKYVIKYGDSEVKHNYKDHIKVLDERYSYQIVGSSLSLSYYAIIEDGNCVFSIGQQGNMFGIQLGQKVIKMKEGAKKFSITSWKYISSFAFFYNNGNEIGTDEKLLSKKIITDGNLMARVEIVTASSNEKVKTKAYYTYYYNPSDNKRIFVRFEHDILKKCNVKGEENGIFSYLMCLKSRSNAIKELNMGEILPHIHVYGRNGVEEYEMETNPTSKEYKWLISSKDNVILGSTPWFCMDNNEAYGLIMDKNATGLQIKALVKKRLAIPGLAVAGGGVSVGLPGENDVINPARYSYFCELYFGSGLKNFEEEAKAFYNFYEYRQKWKEEKKEMHNLKVIIHSILPFKMHVEVWDNESMIAEEDAKWRRASFNLSRGNYIIKVYARGKFVGERSIRLNEDKKVHIFCSFEGKLVVKTNEGVDAILLDGSQIVAKNKSNGIAVLKAPLFYKYRLRLSYKGFILYEKDIFLTYKRIEKEFKFYSFYVKLYDGLNLPFEENAVVYLMRNGSILYGERKGNIYSFNAIPEGYYLLKTSYKNFEVENNIHIPSESMEIKIPVVYNVKVEVYDNRGIKTHAIIKFERNGKEFGMDKLPPAKYKINVYYGNGKASMERHITTDEKIDIVINKNSWILYATIFFLAIIFIMLLLKRKFVSAAIILFSFSILFKWWYVGNSSLYIFPPSMIKFYSRYGEIISLPSLLKYALLLTLISFIFSILMALLQKYKISFIFSIASLTIFTYSIHTLAKFSTGSIYGSGLVEGSYISWGMGIGFYTAIIFAMLVAGLILNDIRRSR